MVSNFIDWSFIHLIGRSTNIYQILSPLFFVKKKVLFSSIYYH